MPLSDAIERIWYGRSAGAGAARLALSPLAAAYAAVAGVRNRLYDAGLLPATEPAIPAVSVGNLTVGGTGKTPIVAWIVAAARDRGCRPGVVLRGYRDGDEADVHRTLNPHVPVIASADRVAGIRALIERGCDLAVLDDAFQHRRTQRTLDVVLVNADRWAGVRWPLPAGPWREPVSSLRRAQLVLITRKVATAAMVDTVRRALERALSRGAAPVAIVSLVPASLRTLDRGAAALGSLRGARVRAVAGVADPAAFFAQLRAAGARVDGIAFRDHHRYTAADVAEIRRRAPPGVTVICTLKDAVKLGALWPREAEPIWYVSQRVEFERGGEVVQAALDAVSRVRPAPG